MTLSPTHFQRAEGSTVPSGRISEEKLGEKEVEPTPEPQESSHRGARQGQTSPDRARQEGRYTGLAKSHLTCLSSLSACTGSLMPSRRT